MRDAGDDFRDAGDDLRDEDLEDLLRDDLLRDEIEDFDDFRDEADELRDRTDDRRDDDFAGDLSLTRQSQLLHYLYVRGRHNMISTITVTRK